MLLPSPPLVWSQVLGMNKTWYWHNNLRPVIEYQITLSTFVSLFGLPVSEVKKLIIQAVGLVQQKLIKRKELRRPQSHGLYLKAYGLV